jgi:hypothetical protein
MAHSPFDQVSFLDVANTAQEAPMAHGHGQMAPAPAKTVMVLRPSLPPPPLGRKPAWVAPTDLLDQERRRPSAL